VEVLSLRIKQNKNIKGYTLTHGKNQREITISQFADDSMLLLQDKHQRVMALEEIDIFGQTAGLKLNKLKTVGMYLGKDKNKQEVYKGIRIENDPIKCLGIFVGYNRDLCEQLNWDKKIQSIENLITRWAKRNLTIFGKITIIKTLILPKFTFLATNVNTPQSKINTINSILYAYIWGKRDRMKRNVLIRKLEDGGLGMTDLESHFRAVKASWVRRMIADSDDNWIFLAKEYLNMFGSNFLILHSSHLCEQHFKDISLLPQFYQEIVLAYSKTKIYTAPEAREDILSCILWANHNIAVRQNGVDEVLHFKSFIESNIRYVKDLKFFNGAIDTTYLYEKIKDKRNIYAEIIKLQIALRAVTKLIKSHTPATENDLLISPEITLTCNQLYWRFIDIKSEKPKAQNKLITIEPPSRAFKAIYTYKIKRLRDPKLAQFNYKILNLILPCNTNLKLWAKSNSDQCAICGETEDILHLLFLCSHAQTIWQIVEGGLNIRITTALLLYGSSNDTENYIVTLIAYLIYKQWIICEDRNILKHKTKTINCFISELAYRNKIISALNEVDVYENVEQVLKSFLRNNINNPA
jgi:hypothetical protein